MKIETYSHYKGEQIVDQKISQDLRHKLRQMPFTFTPGCARTLRREILEALTLLGWSNKIGLDSDSKISLTSSFHSHVLSFQTGNMGRFYADLLKMQYVFTKQTAKAAFFIIPSKDAAKAMGDNIANFDRFKRELHLFEHIITIPILVLGIN